MARGPRTLSLGVAVPDGAAAMSGTVAVSAGGETLELSVTVPAGPARLDALLPLFHGVADAVVDGAAALAAASGRPVTCGMGCAACCRQAVPVSPSEARALAALVAALPVERRTVVEARFAAARRDSATVLAATLAADPQADSQAYGLAWHARGVACPFLEDEHCSIYDVRPLICREHLVTSPPVECATPGSGRVEGLAGTTPMSRAFRAVDTVQAQTGVMLLSDALVWSAAHPPAAPHHPAPDLVLAVFSHLGDGG